MASVERAKAMRVLMNNKCLRNHDLKLFKIIGMPSFPDEFKI